MEMLWFVLSVCVLIVQADTNTATTTNTTEPAKLATATAATTNVTDDRPVNTEPYNVSPQKGNDEITISSYGDKKTSVQPPPPQTFKLDNIVTSGPIILVDKKSLFITSFRYNGDHKNVHFWVGNDSTPSSKGIIVPNENGSTENLPSYQGQNLNITLPNGVTTDDIEYFGVWSIDEELDLGHVPIKGIKDVPQVSTRKKTVSQDIANGCEAKSVLPDFRPPFNVYDHNETHFSNESLNVDLIDFQPHFFAPKCEYGKYTLEEETEEFALLKNNSVLVKHKAKSETRSGILLSDQFCLEHIEGENNTFQMKILVCVPSDHKIEKAMFFTYVTLTIISTFCLAITFFLYFFWLKVEDVHRKCFTGYTFTMTITFLSLTIVQTAKVEDGGCNFLGFLFQIFMIASFTLLGILCFDVFFIIKYIDEKKCVRLRKRWYLGISIGVPLLFLFISLARNLTPDVPISFFKPQYNSNYCFFEADKQRTIIFYVPICLSMVVSAVFLGWSKYLIIQNDRHKEYDYFWRDKGTLYKFMWRKHLIIILTSVLWFIETLIRMEFANSNMLIAIDIVEASQGILVIMLFVVNKHTRTQIVNRIKEQRKKRKKKNPETEEEREEQREEEFMLTLVMT